MKTQLYRVTLYSIIVYLTIAVLHPALAVPPPEDDGEPHFCGVCDRPPDGHPSNQFPNRRYARTLANLDVSEPRTVRLIYFLPNDRPYRADVVQRMKEMIRGVQGFFAEQMRSAGYGGGFRVETDAQGDPLVHRVGGKHANNGYFGKTISTMDVVHNEISLAFDLSANVYLTVIDNGAVGTGGITMGNGNNAAGIATFPINKIGGFALVADGSIFDEFYWEIAAHELGHTFGLYHDFSVSAYMSYASVGLDQKRLSPLHAELLSVNPYFNTDIPIQEGALPTIEILSPSKYPAGSESVAVQIALSDTDGLHQVFLIDQRIYARCGITRNRVWDGRTLAGEKHATVTFNYDGGAGTFYFR